MKKPGSKPRPCIFPVGYVCFVDPESIVVPELETGLFMVSENWVCPISGKEMVNIFNLTSDYAHTQGSRIGMNIPISHVIFTSSLN